MKTQEYNISDSPAPTAVKRASFLYESLSFLQPARLLTQSMELVQAKRGNGQRIILMPGWKTNALSLYPLKGYLAALGYAPEDWGLGVNQGQVEQYRDKIAQQLADEEGKITLIGWSLGGTVAREVARILPDKIGSVITFGTPVIGGPMYTIGENFWDKAETKRINALTEELNETHPIQVPMSIIFTKKDSIVNWAACLDKKSKNVRHYEVSSTHLSMGIDPHVWRIITDHLERYA
ncbi:MAG: alpha/beta hydrolase [Bacteroidota bacterium]